MWSVQVLASNLKLTSKIWWTLPTLPSLPKIGIALLRPIRQHKRSSTCLGARCFQWYRQIHCTNAEHEYALLGVGNLNFGVAADFANVNDIRTRTIVEASKVLSSPESISQAHF